MSQPKAQPATKNNRTIFVATIKFSVMTKMTEESKRYWLRHRKLSRDRANKLKEKNVCRNRENYVMTGSKSWRT